MSTSDSHRSKDVRCATCGDPAMVIVAADPFGKSDAVRSFCSKHAPPVDWPIPAALSLNPSNAGRLLDRLTDPDFGREVAIIRKVYEAELAKRGETIERLRDENELLKDACGCQNGAIERLTRELAAEKQSADYAWKNTRELDAERMKWGKALERIANAGKGDDDYYRQGRIAREALRGADEPTAALPAGFGTAPDWRCCSMDPDFGSARCEKQAGHAGGHRCCYIEWYDMPSEETSAAHKPGCWKLHSPSGNGKCNCGAEREEPNE